MDPFTPSQSWINAANNRLVNAGLGIGYDAAGNQTSIGGYARSYDGENRLKTAVQGTATTEYSYDGDGRRVKKVQGSATTVYVYDAGGNLAAEYSTQLETPPCTTCYLTADHLGSTRLMTDGASGAAVALHDYLPFGEEIPAGIGGRSSLYGSDAPRQRFTGKERDMETSLDYFGARYLSAAQGRWTIPDWSARPEAVPYAKLDNPQSLNLYSYVLNNPLRYADPDGHVDRASCGVNDPSTCVVAMMQLTQNVNFYNRQGDVVSTVRVTTDLSVVSNSLTDAVVSVGATSTAANVSGQAFSKSQLATIGSTVGAVMQAGASMSLGPNPPQLMTAILAKESTLGVLAPMNPLQLSGTSGSRANGDRQHNIQGALGVLQWAGRARDFDPASTYSRYNGVPDPAQRAANVNNFMQIYNGMSQSWWGYNPEIPDPPLPRELR